jgi:hypothetical protein
MDGVKQQDSMLQNDSNLDFKWIKQIAQTKRRPHFFFQNNLTFVIQILINVFPRIVFFRTFFLHTSRESNNIYIVFV